MLLERIKAGEDIRVLACKLSIYRDADRGGEVKGARDYLIKRHFGGSFLSAIHAGEENDLIGPIKVKDGYEIARIDKRVEKTVLDFEQAERYIRPRLEREKKKRAFTELLDKLKKQSAGRITRSSRFFPAEEK